VPASVNIKKRFRTYLHNSKLEYLFHLKTIIREKSPSHVLFTLCIGNENAKRGRYQWAFLNYTIFLNNIINNNIEIVA
jgi:hypothetical protein